MGYEMECSIVCVCRETIVLVSGFTVGTLITLLDFNKPFTHMPIIHAQKPLIDCKTNFIAQSSDRHRLA
jgi:hypothetical protein